MDVYRQAAEYIRNADLDEREVTQFIIGAVSELDTPMTPAARGLYSLGGYLTGLSMEQVQKERDELLAADADTIRKLAAHIRAFMEDGCLCVVGNEEKIKKQEALFKSVEYLIH